MLDDRKECYSCHMAQGDPEKKWLFYCPKGEHWVHRSQMVAPICYCSECNDKVQKISVLPPPTIEEKEEEEEEEDELVRCKGWGNIEEHFVSPKEIYQKRLCKDCFALKRSKGERYIFSHLASVARKCDVRANLLDVENGLYKASNMKSCFEQSEARNLQYKTFNGDLYLMTLSEGPTQLFIEKKNNQLPYTASNIRFIPRNLKSLVKRPPAKDIKNQKNEGKIIPIGENEKNTLRKIISKTKNTCSRLKTPIEVNVTIEHLIDLYKTQQGKCPNSEVFLTFDLKSPFCVTMERVDQDFGFVKGNIRLICLFRKTSNLPKEKTKRQRT
jgi:hypothetical protein